jgi:DNA-binding HxlR family transcriptional regulator
VLNDRLRELRNADIVALDLERGYVITEHGRELAAALEPLHDWAKAWARRTAASGS